MPDEIMLKYLDGEDELPEMNGVEILDLWADKNGPSYQAVVSEVRKIAQSYRSGRK